MRSGEGSDERELCEERDHQQELRIGELSTVTKSQSSGEYIYIYIHYIDK